VLPERLSTVHLASERQPSEELALLRDELLSEIPALNRILQRSPRISSLQHVLTQADVKMRAGKFIVLTVGAVALIAWG